MTHLMLTSVLLFALLAVVAIAIGASLGIARDLLDETDESAADTQSSAGREGLAGRQALAGRPARGLADDFGLGLQHAARFAQDSDRSYSRSRSFNARV